MQYWRLALGACALPRTGPDKAEIQAGQVLQTNAAPVVMVNDAVAKETYLSPQFTMPAAFLNTPVIGGDMIFEGDVLQLTIWENVKNGLLNTGQNNATQLQVVQVDSDGFIFVPYAGRVKAAGRTPDLLRQDITDRLKGQTPDPQVELRREAGSGASVSVMGAVSAQGVYLIERSSRTLSAMLARSGGIAIAPDVAQVKLIRGNQTGELWFNDLIRDPKLDVALRNDDRIVVKNDSRTFTALGATGVQKRVTFEKQSLSVVEALAEVGGLTSGAADPTGVFIFRDELPQIANQVLGRNDITETQRMVYVVNLTEPNGIFYGRDFYIRDQDTLYVTEAPFTQWSKVISAVNGSLGTVGSVDNALNVLN